mmetsp:Transcript_25297/g.57490  ORF Transcript_25297/g.57490 Transcript_25297/m.57490 type:complete len:321 (+) Transcript_25297:639-1601(+)
MKPIEASSLLPDRMPVDDLAGLQDVLARAPLLPLRRDHVKQRWLCAHADGSILAEALALQAHPYADHLVGGKPVVDGLAVYDPPCALEVPLPCIATPYDPHAIAAGVEPALASDVLPERLSVDQFVRHRHILASAPLLPIWGEHVQRRRLQADRDRGVLVELVASEPQPFAPGLVGHQAPMSSFGVEDASGAFKVPLLGVIATDHPCAVAAGVEPTPPAFLLPHGLPVGNLICQEHVLPGTPLLAVGRDHPHARGRHKGRGEPNRRVLHERVALESMPSAPNFVRIYPSVKDLAEDHAPRAFKVLLLGVAGSNDPHAIDS